MFVELPLDVLYPEKVVKDEFVKNTAGSGLVDKVISWAVERKVNSIYSGGLSYSVPTYCFPFSSGNSAVDRFP